MKSPILHVTGALSFLLLLLIIPTHGQTGNPIPGACGAVGPNLVVNPEFELDSVGFQSAFNYRDDFICNWGDYRMANTVEYRPNTLCFGNGFNLRTIWAVTDRNQPGTGKFMLVDPCDPTGNAPCTANDPTDTRIWQQTIDVCPNTDYTFSVFAKNIYATDVIQYFGANVTPLFELSINDVPVTSYYVDGVFFDPLPVYNLPQDLYADSARWYQISGRVSIGDTTSAKLIIRNIRTGKDGNDLALDGIFFGLCGSAVSLNIQSDIPQCTQNGTIAPIEFRPDPGTQESGWQYYEWKKNGTIVQQGQTISAGIKDSIPPFVTPLENGNYFGTYELVVYPSSNPLMSCGTTSDAITVLDSCAPGTFPVEMTSFTGKKQGNAALLNWETASESNNMGFDIMMSTDGMQFEKIGFVEGNGTTQNTNRYIFQTEALSSGKYQFMLRQIDFDGAIQLSSSVEVLILDRPLRYTLRPNPAKDHAFLTILSNQDDFLQVSLFSPIGQEVKTVLKEQVRQGDELRLSIPTSDLASGVYFLRIRSNNGVMNEQLVIQR